MKYVETGRRKREAGGKERFMDSSVFYLLNLIYSKLGKMFVTKVYLAKI